MAPQPSGFIPCPDCCPVYSGVGIPTSAPTEEAAVFYDLTNPTSPVIYVWNGSAWISVMEDGCCPDLIDNGDGTLSYDNGTGPVTIVTATGVSNADGTATLNFADGSSFDVCEVCPTAIANPDGSVTITNADGTVVEIFPPVIEDPANPGTFLPLPLSPDGAPIVPTGAATVAAAPTAAPAAGDPLAVMVDADGDGIAEAISYWDAANSQWVTFTAGCCVSWCVEDSAVPPVQWMAVAELVGGAVGATVYVDTVAGTIGTPTGDLAPCGVLTLAGVDGVALVPEADGTTCVSPGTNVGVADDVTCGAPVGLVRPVAKGETLLTPDSVDCSDGKLTIFDKQISTTTKGYTITSTGNTTITPGMPLGEFFTSPCVDIPTPCAQRIQIVSQWQFLLDTVPEGDFIQVVPDMNINGGGWNNGANGTWLIASSGGTFNEYTVSAIWSFLTADCSVSTFCARLRLAGAGANPLTSGQISMSQSSIRLWANELCHL